ncbi:MAG TPA: transposase [Thermoanaerobaculia bacterium]|nr:transposase [Thermoanaerobaculia bacterium]
MTSATAQRLKHFALKQLGLQEYLEHPGDGRRWPQIPAAMLVWAQLLGFVLRETSFHGLEALVRSPARRMLALRRSFSEDTLAYFTERLDPAPTRAALARLARQAKRRKSFGAWIGLAVDGTSAGCSAEAHCPLCRPLYNAEHAILGHQHCLSLVSLVGGGLNLPLDVEPYGPGENEVAASQRALGRVVAQVGRRFADYVVVDGYYAGAPFLRQLSAWGLSAVVRLKNNLPELAAAAQQRFTAQPPSLEMWRGADRIELWDASDFDPWEGLDWTSVRVLRYRQHKPDGQVIEAYWLTNLPWQRVGTSQLYDMAKSRWEVENQGFNDAKNRYGLAHIAHHQSQSLVARWLLLLLALTVERLYRLRYLHRGRRPPRTAIEFVRELRLNLCPPPRLNSG